MDILVNKEIGIEIKKLQYDRIGSWSTIYDHVDTLLL